MTFPRKEQLRLVAFCTLFSVLQAIGIHFKIFKCNQPASDYTTIYKFSMRDISGEKLIPLSDYKGKEVLIVNVASFSNWTGLMYLAMNQFQNNMTNGVVLGFPCNQINREEPANNSEILNILKYVRPGDGYVPNFPMFAKIKVNGKNEHALYKYLKRFCPPTNTTFDPDRLNYSPIRSNDVSGSFEIFFVSTEGRVRTRSFPWYAEFTSKSAPFLTMACQLAHGKPHCQWPN